MAVKACFNPHFLNSVQPETNYKVMAVLPAHKTNEYERYEPFYLSSQFAADLLASYCGACGSNSIPGFTERFMQDMQGKLSACPYTYTI